MPTHLRKTNKINISTNYNTSPSRVGLKVIPNELGGPPGSMGLSAYLDVKLCI